jgi:hypothetical protein
MGKIEEIKSFFKQELNRIKSVPWPHTSTFFAHFAKILLFVQFIHMAGALFELRQSLGMMYSRGDDASHAVYVATKTKWYNMNGWYAYGPVYYRLTHTLARLVTAPALPGQTPNEVVEMNHHFILTLISLISLFGIAFLIAWMLMPQNYLKYFATSALVSAFMSTHYMTDMIYTAHPDFVAIFFLMLAMYFTSKMMSRPKDEGLFLITAFTWGVAACTKMIFVYFLPITPFFWKIERSKAYVKRLILFYVYMFIAYLVVGFPQNFRVDKVLIFMKYMSGFTRPITWDFFKIWINLTVEQFWLPLVIVLIFGLIPRAKDDQPDANSSMDKKNVLKLFGLAFVPLCLIYSRRLIHHYYHYPFPFGMVLLLCLAMVIRCYKNEIKYVVPRIGFVPLLLGIIALTGIKLGLTFVPEAYYKSRSDQKTCWNERKEYHDLINERLKNGVSMLADPNVSYNALYKNQVYRSYTKLIPDLRKYSASLVALTSHGNRYFKSTGISEYIQQDIPNWKEVVDFYLIFRGKDETVDPFGHEWKRIYHNNKCSYQLYERQN